jgi:hypothetical protein
MSNKQLNLSCESYPSTRQNFLQTCGVRCVHQCEHNIKGFLPQLILFRYAQRTLRDSLQTLSCMEALAKSFLLLRTISYRSPSFNSLSLGVKL